MGFNVKSFENLKTAFDTTVKQLLEKHSIDDVDKLSEERKGQVKFLSTAISYLEKSTLTSENRARVLTGLMIVIREVINNSYTLSPEKSGLYRLLPDAMGISKDHAMSSKDRANLAEKARSFITTQVFTDIHLKEMRIDHTFSNINGFGLRTESGIEALDKIWKTANELAFKGNNDSFDHAANQTRQALKETMPKTSGPSRFFNKAEKGADEVDNNSASAAVAGLKK